MTLPPDPADSREGNFKRNSQRPPFTLAASDLEDHEWFDTPWGRVERFGRFLVSRSLLDHKTHQSMKDKLSRSAPEARARVDELISRLRTLCGSCDPIDLLGQMATQWSLAFDSEHRHEMLGAPSQAYLEYLAAVVTAAALPLHVPRATPDVSQECATLLRDIFTGATWYFVADGVKKPNGDAATASFVARTQHMCIRGDALASHETEYLERLIRPHTAFLVTEFGFSANDLFDVLRDVDAQIQENVEHHSRELRRVHLSGVRRLRQFAKSLPEDTRIPSKEALFDLFRQTAEGRKSQEMFREWLDRSPAELFVIRPRSDAHRAVLTLLSLEVGANAPFAQVPEWGHWPNNPSLFKTHSIICHAGRYYAFAPGTLLRNLASSVESAIRARSEDYYAHLKECKGALLETMVAELIAKRVPGASVRRGSCYRTSAASPEFDGEIDVIARWGDVLMLFECKSAEFADSARRGGDRLRRTVKELILEPADQLSRAENYVRSHRHAVFHDRTGKELLAIADTRNVTLVIRVAVSIDSLGHFAASLRRLNYCDPDADVAAWPIQLNVHDLRLMTEATTTPEAFVSYLAVRQLTKHAKSLAVSDEIDLLGYFILEDSPLAFLDLDENATMGLTGYAETLLLGSDGSRPDIGVAKHELVRDPRLLALAAELTGGHAVHLACLLLQMTCQGGAELADKLERATQAVRASQGRRSFTYFIRALDLSVMILVGYRGDLPSPDWVKPRLQVAQYAGRFSRAWAIMINVGAESSRVVAVARASVSLEANPELDRLVGVLVGERCAAAADAGRPLTEASACPCGIGAAFGKCHMESATAAGYWNPPE